MALSRRALLRAAAASALPLPAFAQPRPAPVRIGVLADFSGLYQDLLGMAGVECARQAVTDFDPAAHGFAAEVLYADHQNKPDVGVTIVRDWFDNGGVDMLIAGPNSAVGLAVSHVTQEKNKVCMGTAVTASEFTGRDCTPNTVNWTYDAYMLSRAVAVEITRSGGKSWYFISTDNAFGASLQSETSRLVGQAGGTVLGSARAPLGTPDFSALLLQAQASGAEVLALAVGGADLVNALKQAGEFGLRGRMRVAALVTFLGDVHSAGLPAMQGLLFTNSFYWDLNERTRAFTERLLANQKGAVPPDMIQAGCYAGTLHYLKAVQALGVAAAKASGADTAAKMKSMPCDDDAFGHSTIRADGRQISPAYLFQVKTPAESKSEWDLYKLIATTPADEAYQPLSEGHCSLVKT